MRTKTIYMAFFENIGTNPIEELYKKMKQPSNASITTIEPYDDKWIIRSTSSFDTSLVFQEKCGDISCIVDPFVIIRYIQEILNRNPFDDDFYIEYATARIAKYNHANDTMCIVSDPVFIFSTHSYKSYPTAYSVMRESILCRDTLMIL